MLAREYCDMTKPKIKFKPVILSHHMLAGLKEGQAKMSKSDPGEILTSNMYIVYIHSVRIFGLECPKGISSQAFGVPVDGLAVGGRGGKHDVSDMKGSCLSCSVSVYCASTS